MEKVDIILLIVSIVIVLLAAIEGMKIEKKEKEALDKMFHYPFGREGAAKDFQSGTMCVEVEFPWDNRKRYVEYTGRPEDFHKIRASVFGALFSKMGVPYWKLGEAMRWARVRFVQRR